MAPEQLRALDPEQGGDPSQVNAASDIFSLGVILAELLTGVHPFGLTAAKASARQIRAQLFERQRSGPLPLRKINPRVDRRLARLIERCMAFEPSARPQSAEELAAELRRSLSWGRRTRRWVAEHARWVVLISLLSLLVSGTSSYALWQRAPHSLRQYGKAQAAYQAQRYQDVVSDLSELLRAPRELDSELAFNLYFLRGRAFVKTGQFDAAWSDFKAADQLRRDARVLACQGYCWSLKGRHDWALTCYQSAMVAADAIGLRRDALLNNVARALERDGKVEDARKYLDAALACNERLSPAYYNRARALLGQAFLLTQVRKRPPNLAARVGDLIERAKGDFEKAKHYGPPSAWLFYDAARLWMFAVDEEKGDDVRRQASAEQVLHNLRQAIQYGFSSDRLKKEELFAELRKDFRAAFDQAMQVEPLIQQSDFSEAIFLVDPIAEGAD
jgi:tetratricopeptide (TPR) repeat protein